MSPTRILKARKKREIGNEERRRNTLTKEIEEKRVRGEENYTEDKKEKRDYRKRSEKYKREKYVTIPDKKKKRVRSEGKDEKIYRRQPR